MDFKNMTSKQIAKEVVRQAIAEKEAKAQKDALLAELKERGVNGIDAKVGKVLGMIYMVNGSISRIFDNEKLTEFLGAKAEEFKKDKVNPARYAVKLTQN